MFREPPSLEGSDRRETMRSVATPAVVKAAAAMKLAVAEKHMRESSKEYVHGKRAERVPPRAASYSPKAITAPAVARKRRHDSWTNYCSNSTVSFTLGDPLTTSAVA